ncbi:hypothetical protein CAPTEDRAFT_224308 [Capitella teleta]|uniref:Uncharacterized protein n=1 Tax=Capitella teleta TaxID=283909 RepID=R7UIC0_CAPTE|nr:hypothetical protein CAPTEDRAFT_224308 [Capitella teleta]|eukprot:ELU05950.1 hypothetical protein CAPTEDRAFT_224308 [Capitella teleta]
MGCLKSKPSSSQTLTNENGDSPPKQYSCGDTDDGECPAYHLHIINGRRIVQGPSLYPYFEFFDDMLIPITRKTKSNSPDSIQVSDICHLPAISATQVSLIATVVLLPLLWRELRAVHICAGGRFPPARSIFHLTILCLRVHICGCVSAGVSRTQSDGLETDRGAEKPALDKSQRRHSGVSGPVTIASVECAETTNQMRNMARTHGPPAHM